MATGIFKPNPDTFTRYLAERSSDTDFLRKVASFAKNLASVFLHFEPSSKAAASLKDVCTTTVSVIGLVGTPKSWDELTGWKGGVTDLVEKGTNFLGGAAYSIGFLGKIFAAAHPMIKSTAAFLPWVALGDAMFLVSDTKKAADYTVELLDGTQHCNEATTAAVRKATCAKLAKTVASIAQSMISLFAQWLALTIASPVTLLALGVTAATMGLTADVYANYCAPYSLAKVPEKSVNADGVEIKLV
jgi:hypothetical protein